MGLRAKQKPSPNKIVRTSGHRSFGSAREKGPDTFRTVAAAALGNSILWTPTAGRRFRLLGGVISIPGTCTIAAAGLVRISIFDGLVTTNIVFSVSIPAAVAAVPVNVFCPFELAPRGYVSTAVDNICRVNLDVALTAGAIRVTVWGTEEP